MSIYEQKGFANRTEYLYMLANDYGIDASVVIQLSNLLGESEDFDGLINAIEDIIK